MYPSAPHVRVETPTEDPAEEVGDGDSQNSYRDSAMSSVIDFDPDDTMVSQQTLATEVTQPLRSSISQVSRTMSPAPVIEYAESSPACRDATTPTTACPLQSPDEPDQPSSVATPHLAKRAIAISGPITYAR